MEEQPAKSPGVEALKATVAMAPSILMMIDNSGCLVAVSGAACASLGLKAEEVAGRPMHELVGGAEETGRALAEAGVATKAVVLPLRRATLPDGTVSWYESQAWPWYDDDGRVGGHLFQVRDVSGEQRALAGLNRTEALLDAVVESMPSQLAVYDVDADTIVRVNRAYETFLGKPRSEIVDQPRPDNYTDSDFQAFMTLVESARETGQVIESERDLKDGAGRMRTVHGRSRYIEDRVGGRYILMVADDVTEPRETERALQAALADAEAANQAKSTFLAIMSHEIRTPLNGVLGMAQAMANDPLPEVQRERLDVVRRSGEALHVILNDILDLSKIEAGKLELEDTPFDFEEVVEDAVASFRPIAEANGVALRVDVEGAAGVYRGDPTRLRQVISNLVSNALKFTADGRIELKAEVSGEAVVICVRDTGPGLSADFLPRAFENFVQADVSTTRRFGGTGLGLAICRHLVELMGGTIIADNHPEGGARFIVTAPLKRTGEAARKGRKPEEGPPPDDLRILAAEDNPVNQLVLKTLFGQVGLSVTIASDGAQALAAFAPGA